MARPGAAARGESVYSQALGEAICARVAAGEGLRGICAEAGQPHRTTVQNWRRAHPEFDLALCQAFRVKRTGAVMRDRQRAAERALRPPPRGGGKASGYTHALGQVICARLEAGESLTSVARDPAMPAYGTILKWVKAHPEFHDMYVTARAIQGDYLFDEARDVAKGAARQDVPAARLQFDVIRWQAASLAPKKYLPRVVAWDARDAAGREAEETEGAADAAPEGGAGEGGREAQLRARWDREGGPRQVNFTVTHFELGPDRRVLAAPPRNAEEAQAWIESTGQPYEAGVSPTGQVRPPMKTPQQWEDAEVYGRWVVEKRARGRGGRG